MLLEQGCGNRDLKKGEKGLGKGSKRIRDKCEEESRIGDTIRIKNFIQIKRSNKRADKIFPLKIPY